MLEAPPSLPDGRRLWLEMSEQKNLLIAIVISVAILVLFQVFYEIPRMRQQQAEWERQQALTEQSHDETGAAVAPDRLLPEPGVGTPTAPTRPGGIPGMGTGADAGMATQVATELTDGGRLEIITPRLHGSLALRGARLDDLTLADYQATIDPDSAEIVLLAPSGSRHAYYAEFGWVPEDDSIPTPGSDAVWQTSQTQLTPESPVTLRWDNGAGLIFERTIAVDENYMFTVEQTVRNSSDTSVTLFPYGLVLRQGTPQTTGFYILHEGPLGVFDGELAEWDYASLQDEGRVERTTTGGWIGITDKYWLVSLIPDQRQTVATRFVHTVRQGLDRYQVDALGSGVVVTPGASVTETSQLFAGAKEVTLLDSYADTYGIIHFDLAVDFGWFYFLTKPFFYALYYLNSVFGNFGVAILIFTVFVKLLFYPLADKSYQAMSKMKKLQPEMMKIRERYQNDKMRMNEEMMALYKREKANPVSGCLPILIQIPVFFALYKVLFVTIEMRHAPFFGWIQDLSAPDPTSLFNLFGLLPFQPPEFLMIGVWPLIMGGSMWLQQKMNPAPPDPVQAKIFMFLPILFTFLLATFPAGLVIYWTWNNLLSMLQQWVIMRRMGVKIT